MLKITVLYGHRQMPVLLKSIIQKRFAAGVMENLKIKSGKTKEGTGSTFNIQLPV